MGMLQGGLLSQVAAGGGPALDTTITAANSVVSTTTTTSPTTKTYDLDADGFDAGSDYYSSAGTFGSIANATYTDGGSNSRTIDSLYRMDTPDAPLDDHIFFCIDTTSVPNTDATFSKIVIGTTDLLRSAANYYASKDGGTVWEWEDQDGTLLDPTGNDWNFEVHVV